MKVLNLLWLFFVSILVLVVFKQWFSLNLISSGDFVPFSVLNITFFPYAWGLNFITWGMGGFASAYSWSHFIQVVPAFLVNRFGMSDEIIIRFFYFYPLLLLLFLAPYLLFKKVFPESKFGLIASLIYGLNTYVLMLIGGGQIFIAISYSIIPILFRLFISVCSETENRRALLISIVLGLVLSLLTMIDLRFSYGALTGLFIFGLIYLFFSNHSKKIRTIFLGFIFPGIISLLLNLFWVLPTLLTKTSFQGLGEIYTSPLALQFFSFAKFENTISLLHPNWPENIFGKTYFMRPEFLILPLLAFSSLLFIYKEKKERKVLILCFTFLGLAGAFLSKGVNEPFGVLYKWFFENIPGFFMFRDPTKWYVLIALSYSVLIPYSVSRIYGHIKSFGFFPKRKYLNLQSIFLFVFIFYLVFLIKPAIVGNLSGAFKTTAMPDDYKVFNSFLSSQDSFFRTLWMPSYQRYGFNSSKHPAISPESFFPSSSRSSMLRTLSESSTEKLLQDSAIKYVLVPYDSSSEIFIKDRKYNADEYSETVRKIGQIEYLKEVKGFGRIKVFEVKGNRDHFFSDSGKVSIEYEFVDPTKYELNISNAKQGDLVFFSERFDPEWEFKTSQGNILSRKFKNNINSFVIPKSGNYSGVVYYKPQDYVKLGVTISVISLMVLIVFLTLNLINRRTRG